MIRIIRTFLLAVLLGLLGDICFFALTPQPTLIKEIRPPEFDTVEAAAVFFHDFNPQWNGISNETKRRLDYGIALFKLGKVGALIPCGGNKVERQLSGAGLMADYAEMRDVPRGRIYVEGSSHDSSTNILNVIQLMKKKGFRSAVFISSPHHVRRLQKIYQEKNAGLKILFASYSPTDCVPPLTRAEIWQVAHYDLLANLAKTILTEGLYNDIVLWIRRHTDF